jgi:peptidoglycan/LPS O-acetylase OafA/YrhL
VATRPASHHKSISLDENRSPAGTITFPDRNVSSTPGHDVRFYRPELDVLRFFAFLSVFLCHGLPGVEISNHSGWLRLAARGYSSFAVAGSFGVCLFFVLSSFLITELLMRERAATKTVHVQAFYIRRILRIWPLYFLFLLLGYLLGFLVPDWRIGAPRMIAFLTLLGNWYVAAFGMTSSPIAPLWSISIEEQFYLTWPWLAKIGGRTGILLVSALLLPLSGVAIYLLSQSGKGASQVIWFNSVVQFEFFALGAALALLLNGRVPRWSVASMSVAPRLGLLLVSAALWVGGEGFFHLRESVLRPGPFSYLIGYQFVGLGCILMLLAFLGLPSEWIPRKLVYLGKISYGLYVFHYLCLDVVSWSFVHVFSTAHGMVAVTIRALSTMSLAMLLTIVMAAVSYRFFERPFLRLKERYTFVRSRAA